MCKAILSFFLICFYTHVLAQDKRNIRVTVVNEKKIALQGSTVYLLTTDSVIIHSAAANAAGAIEFYEVNPGKYLVKEAGRDTKKGIADGSILKKILCLQILLS